jgi:hypothetical protein
LNERYVRRYSYVGNKRIESLRRAIDIFAYGSLLLDICIAVVTTLSIFNITTGEFVLVPINYLLTSVVIMSLVSGGMLLYVKHYERMMAEMLKIKYKIKASWISSPSDTFNFRLGIRKKIRSLLNM